MFLSFSAHPSSLRRRCIRPRLELLEDRLAPATGLFHEDFTSDLNATLTGFDLWDNDPNTTLIDQMQIVNDLPQYGSANSGPTGRNGYYAIEQIQSGTPGAGLLADGYVLGVISSNLQQPQVTFTVPNVGTPGGLEAGEEVSGIGISVLGYGTVVIEGTRGSISTQFNEWAWRRVSATSNDLLPGGIELGAILSLRVYSLEIVYMDIVSVQVTSTVANRPPTAVDDFVLVNREFGISEVFFPLQGDYDQDGDTMEIISFTQPARGVVDQLQGGYRYRANADALNDPSFREDSFTYTIRDSQGATSTATATLFLNYRPYGNGDFYTAPHQLSVPLIVSAAGGLLVNDLDLDGDPLTIRLFQAPQFGIVTINPDGSFIYSPTTPHGRFVPDQFQYVLNDGLQDSNSVIVLIRPENAVPVASGGNIVAAHGAPTPLSGSFVFSDANGDPVTASLVDAPDHGSVTFTFNNGRVDVLYETPQGRAIGSDQFTYRLFDGFGYSNEATVNVQVPNQRPRIVPIIEFGQDHYASQDAGPNSMTFAMTSGNTVTTGELFWNGGPGFPNLANYLYYKDYSDPTNPQSGYYQRILAEDLDGDLLAADPNLVNQPRHGNVVLEPDGHFTYTPLPDSGLFGTDTFSYRITDGVALSDHVVFVTIRQSLGKGIARSDAFSYSFTDNPRRFTIEDFLANDSFATGWYASLFSDSIHLGTPGQTYLSAAHPDGSIDFFQNPSDPITRNEPFYYVAVYQGPDPGPGPFRLRYQFLFASPGFLPDAAASLSTEGVVLIDDTPEPEQDTDGVPDDIEEAIGDGNGDGQPDYLQAHVASLPNIYGIDTTIASEGGTSLFDVQAIEPPLGPNGSLPEFQAFRLGVFSFQVVGLGAGEAATVTITPSAQADLFTTYYKFGLEPNDRQETSWNDTNTPHWYEFLFDGTTGAEFDNYFDPDLQRMVTRKIILHLVDGARGDDDLDSDGIITDPGGPAFRLNPQVERVIINNGQTQRSKFFYIQVLFNDVVSVSKSAFELFLGNKRFPIASIVTNIVDGKTLATLQFASKLLGGLSLPEGQYRLVTKAHMVRSASGTTMTADHTDRFFRLFGDVNGDGKVNAIDQAVFSTALGKRSNQAGYLWHLDFDSNGSIDHRDQTAFLQRKARTR